MHLDRDDGIGIQLAHRGHLSLKDTYSTKLSNVTRAPPATTIVPLASEAIMARSRNPRLPNSGNGIQARTLAMRLRAATSASVALAIVTCVFLLMLAVKLGGRPTTKLSDGKPAPQHAGAPALVCALGSAARGRALYMFPFAATAS